MQRAAKILIALAAGALLAACAGERTPTVTSPIERHSGGQRGSTPQSGAAEGRLAARPDSGRGERPRTGLQTLGLAPERDALLYVPRGYDPKRPAPLVVMLHGAGSCAERGLRPFIPHADEHGLILLAPPSRDRTWDVILGSFGPDVSFIDLALEKVFERYAIDRRHLAVEGFSDGASYALSLGVTNGDLFSHVIAFSPGFMAPGEPAGRPPVFISHGTEDGVLPIDATSRKIVPRLEDEGYKVTYIEFPGRHMAAPLMAREALAWFLGNDVGAGDPNQTIGDERC